MKETLRLISTLALYVGIPVLFFAIIFYVYRPKRRDRFREDANMIFKDEDDRKHHQD